MLFINVVFVVSYFLQNCSHFYCWLYI